MVRRSIGPSAALLSAPRHHRTWFLVVLAAALLTLLVTGVSTAQSDHAGHDAVNFTAHDYSFEGPSELSAGWQTVTLTNEGAEAHHLQFARLNDDVTPEQFFETLAAEGEAALRLATLTGGVGMIPPGQSAEVLVDFTQPGTYVLLCFLPNAEGVPHLALGMTDVLQVTGEATDASAEEPAADLEIHMRDFAFDIPATLPAGPQTWKVVNDGPQPHEMILVKLNEGATFEQFVAELETNGEANLPGVPIGGAQALNAGLASYLTYDLEPGDYAVICSVPDPETGEPHYMLGMAAGFTVEGATTGN